MLKKQSFEMIGREKENVLQLNIIYERLPNIIILNLMLGGY